LLTLATTQQYTKHDYIQIQDYEEVIPEFGARNGFPLEKVLKILYLSNLALLLVHLIELMGEWESMTPEVRALDIGCIALAFPTKFLAPGQRRGTDEAHITLELRTQLFVQTLLECLGDDELQWDTNQRVEEILKFDPTDERPRDPEERKVHSL
jgi:hypothetical protein